MDKPYGYKESDVIALAHFIKNGEFKGKTLSQGFKNYAELYGKSSGSVRNLYYALAKFSKEHKDFAEKHLGGEVVNVEKPNAFSKEEERYIIAKIQDYKKMGVSVRKATLLLANGDPKLALRFQNKFRCAIRASGELKTDEKDSALKVIPSQIFLVNRLKKEIDKLTDRLFLPLKKENIRLKNENLALKSENERLKSQLFGKNGRVLRYFGRNVGTPDSETVRH